MRIQKLAPANLNMASTEENLFEGSCLPTSGDFLEKDECALNSHVGTILPNSLNADATAKIWVKDQWDHCVLKVNNVENVIEKLLEVANFSSCKFNLFVPSKTKSFYGAIKGGMILKLKDCTLSHFTTAAIIKIDSEVASGSSNDRCSIGELVAHGELFLRESGPEWDALALGITNLKTITWFHLYHATRSYKIAQSAPTSDVRGSICGFLCAEPVSLGLNLNPKLYKMPLSWSLLQHLGFGQTNHVYLVVNKGIRLALKVPRQGFNLRQDIQYLEDLAGIDGIPKIYQQIDCMLALQPVGEPMSREAISLYRAKGTSLALADLVESLQQVHGRGIVNMDLHPDNIMGAKSVYSKGKIMPYLID